MTIGVIGGSGIQKLDLISVKKKHDIDTPFGKPSSQIIEATLDGNTFYFLKRHGSGHIYNPSEINYRANIYALKMVGVTNLLSISAVGSLKEELPPTTIVLPDQFIDWTKGLRKRSFFEDGVVGHVSVAEPIDCKLQKKVFDMCKRAEVNTSLGGSYLCIEGPQFSTKAESNIYRSFGASVIGMTNVPECFLAVEAGINYATLAMVTDYDCWKEEHCTVEEILKVMETNYISVQKVLAHLIPELTNDPPSRTIKNENAIMTAPDLIPKEKERVLKVLLA